MRIRVGLTDERLRLSRASSPKSSMIDLVVATDWLKFFLNQAVNGEVPPLRPDRVTLME